MKAKNTDVKITHVKGSLDQAVLNDIKTNGVIIFDETMKWKSKNFHGILDSEGNLKIREQYSWSINLDSLTIVRD